MVGVDGSILMVIIFITHNCLLQTAMDPAWPLSHAVYILCIMTLNGNRRLLWHFCYSLYMDCHSFNYSYAELGLVGYHQLSTMKLLFSYLDKTC